jgi:hypothetical protein
LRKEDAIHVLLKHLEMNKWGETFLCSKWLNINKDLAYKRIINCTDIVELRNMGINPVQN